MLQYIDCAAIRRVRSASLRPRSARPQDEQPPVLCQSKVEMAGPQQSRNVRLGSSSWALSLGQRFAAEGGSIVMRLLPRFLLRLESIEERAHFAEAIGHG